MWTHSLFHSHSHWLILMIEGAIADVYVVYCSPILCEYQNDNVFVFVYVMWSILKFSTSAWFVRVCLLIQSSFCCAHTFAFKPIFIQHLLYAIFRTNTHTRQCQCHTHSKFFSFSLHFIAFIWCTIIAQLKRAKREKKAM